MGGDGMKEYVCTGTMSCDLSTRALKLIAWHAANYNDYAITTCVITHYNCLIIILTRFYNCFLIFAKIYFDFRTNKTGNR